MRTHEGPGGWQVVVIECANGLANVESRRGLTQVFVADLPVPGASEPNRFSAAACTPEGDALMVARHAPLPLFVTPRGNRTVPTRPQQDELLHLSDGDRLILLSASAVAAGASSLESLLERPTRALLETAPVELLIELVDGVGAGAGAIVCRHIAGRSVVDGYPQGDQL